MIFITGPLYSGKRAYACQMLGCGMEELADRAVWDVQGLAAGCESLEALAEEGTDFVYCEDQVIHASEKEAAFSQIYEGGGMRYTVAR